MSIRERHSVWILLYELLPLSIKLQIRISEAFSSLGWATNTVDTGRATAEQVHEKATGQVNNLL